MVYTPEVGISLHRLRSDVKFLQKRYELDEKGKAEGRLVLKYVNTISPLLICLAHN